MQPHPSGRVSQSSTDEVTKAADGEIVLTAVMMYAFKILRKGGFTKIQSQHA